MLGWQWGSGEADDGRVGEGPLVHSGKEIGGEMGATTLEEWDSRGPSSLDLLYH